MARNRYAKMLKTGPVTTKRLLEILFGALFAALMMFALTGFRPFTSGFWYTSPMERLVAYLTLFSIFTALVALLLWCATCLVTLGFGRREKQADHRPEQPRLSIRSSWLYRLACKAAITLLILYFVFNGV